jgi:hypothetical protein
MRGIQALTVVVALTAATAPRLARAGDPVLLFQDDAQVRKEARDLFTAGRKALKDGRTADALDKLKRAYELLPHFQIAAALGEAEVQAKLYRDAAEHLAFSLAEPAAQVEQADHDRRQSLLHDAEAKVGAILVTATPDGTDIRIDGTSVGSAPLPTPIYVNPGASVVVEGNFPGYVAYKQSLTVGAGVRLPVQMTLAKANGPHPIGGGDLDLVEHPVAPPPADALVPTEGGKSNVAIGLGLGGMGAGAAVSVASFIVFANAMTTYHARFDELTALDPHYGACLRVPKPTGCDELQSALNRANTTQYMGWIGAGVGAACGVATLVYVLLPQGKPAKVASGFSIRPDPWGVRGEF